MNWAKQILGKFAMNLFHKRKLHMLLESFIRTVYHFAPLTMPLQLITYLFFCLSNFEEVLFAHQMLDHELVWNGHLSHISECLSKLPLQRMRGFFTCCGIINESVSSLGCTASRCMYHYS